MSGTRTARGVALLASVVAMLGAAGLAGSQVPIKPLPKDTAKAQAKPAAKPAVSTPRIKITKEPAAGGEVALPKIETTKSCEVVTVIDSSRDEDIRADQYKLDSVAAALEQFNLKARLKNEMRDRVANERAMFEAQAAAEKEAQALALKRSLMRGFYLGFAGGASTPLRDSRDGYTGGYNVTIPAGYDWTDLPLGIRTDFTVDHLNGTRIDNQSYQTIAASGDITVWSFNADLKLRMSPPGVGTRTHVYVLGGVGAHRVTGGVYGTTDPNAGQNLSFGNAGTNFGWNAGAGASFAWGPTELFVESRFFQVKTDLPYHMSGGVGTYTSFAPLVLGVQWF